MVRHQNSTAVPAEEGTTHLYSSHDTSFHFDRFFDFGKCTCTKPAREGRIIQGYKRAFARIPSTPCLHSRFTELILFKYSTSAVHPLPFTPHTSKDVPRIMVVCLHRRSEGYLVSMVKNLFRDFLAIHLFKQNPNQMASATVIQQYSPMSHCCCSNPQCRPQVLLHRLSNPQVADQHGKFDSAGWRFASA